MLYLFYFKIALRLYLKKKESATFHFTANIYPDFDLTIKVPPSLAYTVLFFISLF